MKYFKLILILILILFLCGCQSPEDRDLSDFRCNKCGGKWLYKETDNFLNEVHYYYICDNCRRIIYTRTWFGK